MSNEFYDNGKKLIGYEYYDISFLKPNKDCSTCDIYNDYVCSYCEIETVSGTPNVKYTDDLEWVIKKTMKSKIHKNLLKIKKRLDKKTLREPKTRPQWRDRINWDRVNTILNNRYEK